MNSAASEHGRLQASAWVRRFSACLQEGARVLDLASGHGRHARLLASLGHRVVAADRDADALAALAGAHGIETCQVDLEDGTPWPWEEAGFDAVVVSNYLFRPRFDDICALVRPGGLLIYETFMVGNERFGRPRNPDFLLQPGELLERTRATFTVLAFEQGEVSAPAVVQRLCAVKGEATGRLPD